MLLAKPVIFQPTLPVRGATGTPHHELHVVLISTHAPRAGSDAPTPPRPPAGTDFNPRSPCGERQQPKSSTPGFAIFQPTLPVRGATSTIIGTVLGWLLFQPTLPVRGATSTRTCRGGSPGDFNPRSPCGERPQYIALIVFCCQYADQRRAIGPEKQAARTSKRPNAVRTSPVTLGSLMFAPQTTAPRIPRLHTSVSRPRALSSFDTCCPDNRIASCPSQGR